MSRSAALVAIVVLLFAVSAFSQSPAAAPAYADVVQALSSNNLTDASGAMANGQKYLNGVQLIGLYFSAHWCPPCRAFSPKLVEFRDQCRRSKLPFEVVFVSSDRDAKSMQGYMKDVKMAWPAIPYGSQLEKQIQKRFGVTGIPTLIILDGKGNLITRNGRVDVQKLGPMAYTQWTQVAATIQKAQAAAQPPAAAPKPQPAAPAAKGQQ